MEFASAEAYASWLIDQAKLFTVDLEDPSNIARDKILRVANAWPQQQLDYIDTITNESVAHSKTQHEEEVSSNVSNNRCKQQAHLAALFTVSSNARAANRNKAMAVTRSFISRLRSNAALWEDLGAPTRFVLELPIRKKADMRALMVHLGGSFKHVWWEAVECAPDKLQHQEYPDRAAQQISDHRSQKQEASVNDAFRGLVQRWRSQTHVRKQTIRPTMNDSTIYVQCVFSRRPCAEVFRSSSIC